MQASNLSAFSAIKQDCSSGRLKANLEISSAISFPELVSILTPFFGVSFKATGRYDEFPAVIADADGHEIVIFDQPQDEPDDLREKWSYQLTVFPANGEPSQDCTEAVISALSALIPQCEISRIHDA